MDLLTKADRRGEAEANTFNLPRGEALRRAVKAAFRDQRSAVLRYARTGRKAAGPLATKADAFDPASLPGAFPDWTDYGLGALKLAERFTPLLTLTWEAAAAKFAPRVGLDPDRWSVVDRNTADAIRDAALAFSDSMNATTSLQLDEALNRTREELHAGVVTTGESVDALTKRINRIFDGAESWRARRIAQTETSRAVHAAQEKTALDSGVVTGWKWLLSSDACPLCHKVADDAPAVRLGQPFAVVGTDPHYSTVKFPPLHPHCNCTVVEVLDVDEQPKWSDTLIQPTPDREPAPTAEPPPPKPKRPPPPKAPRKPRPEPEPEPEPASGPPIDVGEGTVREIEKVYRTISRGWADGLPSDERKAVALYSSSAHEDINEYARTGALATLYDSTRVEIAKAVRDVDDALETASLPSPVVVYRGVPDLAELGLTADDVGTATIVDDGFLSASLSKRVARAFSGGDEEAAIFRITAPAGVKGASLHGVSKHPLEKEILFARHAIMKVTGVHSDPEGVRIVDVELSYDDRPKRRRPARREPS